MSQTSEPIPNSPEGVVGGFVCPSCKSQMPSLQAENGDCTSYHFCTVCKATWVLVFNCLLPGSWFGFKIRKAD